MTNQFSLWWWCCHTLLSNMLDMLAPNDSGWFTATVDMLLYIYQVKSHKAELVYTVVSGQCSALKLIQTIKLFFVTDLRVQCIRGGNTQYRRQLLQLLGT